MREILSNGYSVPPEFECYLLIRQSYELPKALVGSCEGIGGHVNELLKDPFLQLPHCTSGCTLGRFFRLLHLNSCFFLVFGNKRQSEI
jgi:hypothetical protein